jgi:hypothetical protein
MSELDLPLSVLRQSWLCLLSVFRSLVAEALIPYPCGLIYGGMGGKVMIENGQYLDSIFWAFSVVFFECDRRYTSKMSCFLKATVQWLDFIVRDHSKLIRASISRRVRLLRSVDHSDRLPLNPYYQIGQYCRPARECV